MFSKSTIALFSLKGGKCKVNTYSINNEKVEIIFPFVARHKEYYYYLSGELNHLPYLLSTSVS